MDDELPLLEIQLGGKRYLVNPVLGGALVRLRVKVKQLMNEGTDDEVRAYASVLKLMDKEGL